jgi:hypothetical protein
MVIDTSWHASQGLILFLPCTLPPERSTINAEPPVFYHHLLDEGPKKTETQLLLCRVSLEVSELENLFANFV